MAYLFRVGDTDPKLDYPERALFRPKHKFPDSDTERWGLLNNIEYRGLRIPEDLAPYRAVMMAGYRSTVFDTIVLGHAMGVSAPLREVIERIALDQVEFFPLEVELLDATTQQYYFMNVLRNIECLCWNNGNVSDRGRSPNGTRVVGLPAWGAPLDITIKRKAHSGVHIWHEKDAGKISSWIFISDEMAQAFEESSATGIRLIQVKEI
jgi:hypothetical protein